eukprot:6840534-Heterocapsa_arctica.AAC.1
MDKYSSNRKATTSPMCAVIDDSGLVYDRTLIEGCCGANSVFCRDTKSNKGCLTITITAQTNITSKDAAVICDENLQCDTCCRWFSCPCTGGSSWQNYNMTRGPDTVKKILGHWKLFRAF